MAAAKTDPGAGSEGEASRAAFDLLHRGIQEEVWRLGWRSLRPIQAQAIEELILRERHLAILAETAGGKTEAAFLPILSKIAEEPEGSVRALYIGPLRALINDQFRRLEDLCGTIGMPVHRWHGDVSASPKGRLLAAPGGVLLITPESLESLFVNKPAALPALFSGLRFIVIDELHAFLDGERGLHLASLLARLARHAPGAWRVGLSATVGDEAAARRYLAPDDPDGIAVIRSRAEGKELQIKLHAYEERPAEKDLADGDACDPEQRGEGGEEEPPRLEVLRRLAEDLARHARGQANLIFANSRADVELLGDLLRAIERREGLPETFLVHHGSLARDLREDAEALMKEGGARTVIATSTLELGIDIGSVSMVGQVGAPWSVASLIQRAGRSGRKEGEPRRLRLYVRSRPARADDLLARLRLELLRAVAAVDLLLEGWMEPPAAERLDLSTLVQQVMSVIAERGGARAAEIHEALCVQGPFRTVDERLLARVLRCLGGKDIIEQAPEGELILGLEGEKIRARLDFYAAFAAHPAYQVFHEERLLGTLDREGVPAEGSHLVFAGRRWRVRAVDPEKWALHVEPATALKQPLFSGSARAVHSVVRERMRRLLAPSAGEPEHRYLDAEATRLLAGARAAAREAGACERGFLKSGERETLVFTWTGTRIQSALIGLLESRGLHCLDREAAVDIAAGEAAVRGALEEVLAKPPDALALAREFEPKERRKFDRLLDDDLLAESIAREELDVEGALALGREILGDAPG